MSVKLTAREAATVKQRFMIGVRHNERLLKRPFAQALRQYAGEQWPHMDQTSQLSRVIINYTLHVIETRVHSAAFRYPRFVITPTTPIGEGTEPIIQAALRYYWRIGGIQGELGRAKKDSEIFGLGIVYEGWLFETDDGVMVDDGEEEDKPRAVRQDRFFVQRIFPGNFVLSPECGRKLDEAQWCGYWEVSPLSDVKANPHFQNTRQLEGNAENLKNFLPSEKRKSTPDELPDDIRRVRLFHYFEKKRQIHVIMCEEHDKVLYAEEWTWQTGRYPFRYLQGPGDEDSFYGQSMALLIQHPQKELNESRSQLSNYRKMAVPKFQCGPGTLTHKAEVALKSFDPLAIVEHNQEQPESIIPITIPPIQPEVYKTEEAVVTDIQAIAAVSQYQMGNAPSKRTPTAEVNQITQQGGARSQNDVQAFEKLCADVAVDCIAWLKKFAVKTRELPIYHRGVNTGQWVNFSKESIKGEYDVDVAANSTAPPNDADKLQSIGFFIQSINPLIQLMQPALQAGINLLPLIRQVLKALPDIEDVDEIVQGLNPQMPSQPGLGPAGGPPPPPAAVMGPAGGPPFAQPAPQAVPPELLAAIAAGMNGH